MENSNSVDQIPEENKELAITVLLKEYDVICEEIRMYIQEMIKSFIYGGVIVAVYLGVGISSQGPSASSQPGFLYYLPYGFAVVALYFLVLSNIKANLVSQRKDIEERINIIFGHKIMTWDSFMGRVQSRGYIKLGKLWYAKIPTPMLLLGFVIFGASIIVFAVEIETRNPSIIIGLYIVIGILAAYIFLVYPQLADKARSVDLLQKNKKNKSKTRI